MMSAIRLSVLIPFAALVTSCGGMDTVDEPGAVEDRVSASDSAMGACTIGCTGDVLGNWCDGASGTHSTYYGSFLALNCSSAFDSAKMFQRTRSGCDALARQISQEIARSTKTSRSGVDLKGQNACAGVVSWEAY
jgi:hypothetical protein